MAEINGSSGLIECSVVNSIATVDSNIEFASFKSEDLNPVISEESPPSPTSSTTVIVENSADFGTLSNVDRSESSSITGGKDKCESDFTEQSEVNDSAPISKYSEEHSTVVITLAQCSDKNCDKDLDKQELNNQCDNDLKDDSKDSSDANFKKESTVILEELKEVDAEHFGEESSSGISDEEQAGERHWKMGSATSSLTFGGKEPEGSDSGLSSDVKADSLSSDDLTTWEQRTPTPTIKPKSMLKRPGSVEEPQPQPPEKKAKRSIAFGEVNVYYFPRAQGFTCVPSQVRNIV